MVVHLTLNLMMIAFTW